MWSKLPTNLPTNIRENFIKSIGLLHYLTRDSVPSKAVWPKIGPALSKFGSTGFVRMCTKMLFLGNLTNFQLKLIILGQEPF